MKEDKPRLLIVEDDDALRDVLVHNFNDNGYECLTAADGNAALEVAQAEKPDLIILVIMLPKMDGFEVCRILRRSRATPIIMLTAKSDEIDKIVGFELGADDYISKPFSMRELKARIKSKLRNSWMSNASPVVEHEKSSALVSNDLLIDIARYQAIINGTPLNLTPKEFSLLRFFVQNKGEVISRDHILDEVWGCNYFGDTRTVDFHVLRLRRKIEVDAHNPKRLVTIWGIGYKFVA